MQLNLRFIKNNSKQNHPNNPYFLLCYYYGAMPFKIAIMYNYSNIFIQKN